MREPLQDRMRGRWQGVLPQLGVDTRYLRNRHGPCPLCGGGKDRFRFDDRDGTGSWFCNQCGAGNGISLVMKLNGWDFKTAAQRIEALAGTAEVREPKTRADINKQIQAMRQAWGASQQIGKVVRRYLVGRGIEPGDVQDLREAVATCEMRALVRDLNGNGCQVHRTLLTPAGTKADGNCRLFMPGAIPKGAAVRLLAPTDTLGIAEGIETALSAAILFSVPCWAALNTSMLKQWEPPTGVSRVIVFGDADGKFAGQAAAYELARRLASPVPAKITVTVELPAAIGTDWNDVLLDKIAQQNGRSAA